MARSRLLPTTALAALLAACGGNETGPADATTEAAEGSAATGLTPAGGLTPADCEGAPYWDDDAIRTPMANWVLRYGAACPTFRDASARCSRLAGVSEQEKFDCVEENVAMAPEACPESAREAFLDAYAGIYLAMYCRATTRTAVDDVLDAHAHALPPGARDAIAEDCVPRARSPADAARCAADHVRLRAAARSAVDEALAEYADRLPATLLAAIAEGCIGDPGADDVESAVRCAVDDAQDQLALAEIRRETTEAARAALLQRVPPEVAEELLQTCVVSAHSLVQGALCGARLGDAKRDLLAALAPLPGEARAAFVNACMRAPGVVDRSVRLPDPQCVAADVAAFRALQDEAAGYSDEDRASCRRPGARWSSVHDCVRLLWLTDARVESVKTAAVADAAARAEPAYVRPPIVEWCSHELGSRARDVLRRFPFLPAEHAADAVRRRVDVCVGGQRTGFDELARLAGSRHAEAFEACARDLVGYAARYDWRDAAKCLYDHAVKQADRGLLDPLRECRPWHGRDRSADDFAACARSTTEKPE